MEKKRACKQIQGRYLVFFITLGSSLGISLLLTTSASPNFSFSNTAFASSTPNKTIVSLTFDDAPSSIFTYVAPILKTANLPATLYVPSGYIDKQDYLTWLQIKQLADSGWEIGGHTVNHAELPNLTIPSMRQELKADWRELKLRGLHPTSFSAPFGSYDNSSTAEVAKLYASQRTFHNQGLNTWPYNKYLINVQYVKRDTTLTQVKAWVDSAVASDKWLVLVMHEILPDANMGDEWTWSTAQFTDLSKYLNDNAIPTKTVNDVISNFKVQNTNAGFKGSLKGWSTDDAQSIKHNTENFGSYPNPRNSLKITTPTKTAHLFSNKIQVTPTNEYGVRAYLDTRGMTQGEVGFMIDEYDTAGNWISWKWLGGTNHQNVIDYSYTYKPSSLNVSQITLQMSVPSTFIGTAYLDNFELLSPK